MEPGGAQLQHRPPLRFIFDIADLNNFRKSTAAATILKFIAALNAAVEDKPISYPCDVSPACAALLGVIAQLSTWIDNIPPIQQPMRYGNKAFRKWHAQLAERAVELCMTVIQSSASPSAAAEVAAYLVESFGNPVRIDYGTGHETTFVLFLMCLCKIGVFAPKDLPALGLKVFPAYLTTVRRLQRTYWLEPAGSHGVWSLDDYQFLVFLFGSAQLSGHAHIKPRSIHQPDVIEGFAPEYMYLSAIQFINEVKFGAPFAEHSPILNDISELPTWGRVNEGLAKMYEAEVLGKLPVVQHLLFGSILEATWTPSRTPVPSESSSFESFGRAGQEVTASHGARDTVPEDGVAAVAPWVSQPICTHGPDGGCGCPPRPSVSPRLARRSSAGADSESTPSTNASEPDSPTPHAHLHGAGTTNPDDFPTGQGQSPVTNFLAAFGPVPHLTPKLSAEMLAERTGEASPSLLVLPEANESAVSIADGGASATTAASTTNV